MTQGGSIPSGSRGDKDRVAAMFSCRQCSAYFSPPQRRAGRRPQFCSPPCRRTSRLAYARQYGRVWREANRPRADTRPCDHCGAENVRRGNARHCSDSCRRDAAYAAYRARRVPESRRCRVCSVKVGVNAHFCSAHHPRPRGPFELRCATCTRAFPGTGAFAMILPLSEWDAEDFHGYTRQERRRGRQAGS